MRINFFQPIFRKALCFITTLLAFHAPASASGAKASSPSDDFDTLPGFKLETVLEADPAVNGSWISLGKDSEGRLMLGGQRRQPMTRLTLDKGGKIVRTEVLKLPVS